MHCASAAGALSWDMLTYAAPPLPGNPLKSVSVAKTIIDDFYLEVLFSSPLVIN